jgi:hypothetical protein
MRSKFGYLQCASHNLSRPLASHKDIHETTLASLIDMGNDHRIELSHPWLERL